jgi:DNA-directed RNA polymerase subunit RPC12/RpoP
MALINCFECGKEISDKAASCPHCGAPLEKIVINSKQDSDSSENLELLTFPNLPLDLGIGKQITNWAFDACFEGFYDGRENTNSKIPSGKVSVLLHTHGIQIMSGLNFYSIHNTQIISLKKTTQEELAQIDKSVIGRAVVGGLILGPLGAIVGGMSGIGNKEKFINKHYFIINYWDIETQSAQTILISSQEDTKIASFIMRQQKEQSINIKDNRQPEANTMPAWAILCVLVIIVSIIIIFVAS